jgi:type III restriction enzyme
VKAIPERLVARPWLEITFPRVTGYRYDLPPTQLEARFVEESRVILSTQDIPTRTENAPIVGETAILTLDDLKKKRVQEVAFTIAKLILERYFRADCAEGASETGAVLVPGAVQVWLFPQVLAIVRRWMAEECVVCYDDTFPQLLLFTQKAGEAAEKIYRAIVASSGGEKRLRAEVQRYDSTGTTAGISYDTSKTTWTTSPEKCHINLVPCDSGWETKFAQTLESMPNVKSYVKNQNLGFKIPYTFEGRPGNYYPDYLVRIDDGRGSADLLNLVVEISGRELKEKEAKVETALKMWVPGVNAEGRFGRWAFLEIDNPWNAKTAIRDFLEGRKA